jgi:hypothetical protein
MPGRGRRARPDGPPKEKPMDMELNTVLVALMFVTILSMGIGNILVTLADVFNHATRSRRSGVHVAWIVLLLLVHFNLFWQTKALVDREAWQFGDFLLVIAGPVLMFFATNVLLTAPSERESVDLEKFFAALGRRFFLMLVAVQAWILVVAFTLMGGLSSGDTFNIAFGVLPLVLMLNSAHRIQVAGVAVAWVLALLGMVLRGVGLIT